MIQQPPIWKISDINSESNESNHHNRECLLCCMKRNSFLCKKCILSGDFKKTTNSQFSNDSERFKDKKEKLGNLIKAQKNLEEKFQLKVGKLRNFEDLKSNIGKIRNKNQILNLLIKEKRENIIKLTELKKEHNDKNRSLRIILPKYEDKVNKLGDYVLEAVEKNDNLRKKNLELQEQLKQSRRTYIDKLVKFIFPMSQVITNPSPLSDLHREKYQSRKASNESLQPETINEIAEAIRTAYIRGKWKQESLNELQYVIVAPTLPSNGDYSGYCDWIAQSKDGLPSSSSNTGNPGSDVGNVELNRIPAYRISAALTYATQLLQTLSYYLDVRLPYKVSYSDFCTMELNEQQFLRKVTRLNLNVVYLCYTQSLKMQDLQPTHTMENILMLLDFCELGRTGAVDSSDRLMDSRMQSMTDLIENDDDSDDDEDTNLQTGEWETVANIPLTEFTHSAMVHQPQNQASMAAGLMNAAHNSLASLSFWRKGWGK